MSDTYILQLTMTADLSAQEQTVTTPLEICDRCTHRRPDAYGCCGMRIFCVEIRKITLETAIAAMPKHQRVDTDYRWGVAMATNVLTDMLAGTKDAVLARAAGGNSNG